MFIVPEGIRGLPAGAAGSKCSRPVSLKDIYPTLIELCGPPNKPDVYDILERIGRLRLGAAGHVEPIGILLELK